MTTDDLRAEELAGNLERLTSHDVDRARADCIRERCHATLDRRRRRAPQTLSVGLVLRRAVEPALVALLSAVYLTEVVRRALALYGF